MSKKITKMTSFACLALLYPLSFSSLGAGAIPTPDNQTWPSDGIAQREFSDGSQMFIENDHGKWHAWVLTENKSGNVDALDFFTGEHQKVKVKLLNGGYQDNVFTDKNGKVHRATYGANPDSFRFTTAELSDLNLRADSLSLNGSDSTCSLSLDVTTINIDGGGTSRRVPLYHSVPTKPGCASGEFHSSLWTAIDLNDGTVLATTRCWVFRLHKSDLSPAGSAPALHVVDASKIEAVIAQAKGKSIIDAAAYLAESLQLPMDNNTSCKEN